MKDINYRFVDEKLIKEFSKNEWTEFTKENGYIWDEKVYYLAAFSGKEVMGYAKFLMNGGVGELTELIVKKDMRGKKIGSELIDMYEQYCCEKGCHMLSLKTVPKVMDKGFQLYKKKGFEIEAELKNEKFNFDWVVMVKRLKQ